jgi:hypothetical protein
MWHFADLQTVEVVQLRSLFFWDCSSLLRDCCPMFLDCIITTPAGVRSSMENIHWTFDALR